MSSPIIKLKDKSDWARFERAIINASKKYGDVSNSLTSKEATSFVIDLSSAPSKTSIQFIEWEENIKILVRRKAKFVEDSRSFVGFFMDQLEGVMERALRVEILFDDLYAADDAAGLFRLLKQLCIKDAARRVDFQKHAFWNIHQGSSTYNDYVLDYEQQLNALSSSGVTIAEGDQVIIFLCGLSVSFSDKISEIRELRDSEFPKTYLAIKETISLWQQLRSDSRSSDKHVFAVQAMETGIVCFRCGKVGHKGSSCSVPSRGAMCSKCHGKGHLAQFCDQVQQFKTRMVPKNTETNEKVSAVEYQEWDGEYCIG
jgi:hypothetical protein